MKKISLIFFLFLVACSGSNTYTLYRNSIGAAGENVRIHVATFDSDEGGSYNQGNCETARDLFQNQDGVETKFWCEKGTFRN